MQIEWSDRMKHFLAQSRSLSEWQPLPSILSHKVECPYDSYPPVWVDTADLWGQALGGWRGLSPAQCGPVVRQLRRARVRRALRPTPISENLFTGCNVHVWSYGPHQHHGDVFLVGA